MEICNDYKLLKLINLRKVFCKKKLSTSVKHNLYPVTRQSEMTYKVTRPYFKTTFVGGRLFTRTKQ